MRMRWFRVPTKHEEMLARLRETLPQFYFIASPPAPHSLSEEQSVDENFDQAAALWESTAIIVQRKPASEWHSREAVL